ncbi:MAG: polymer-forming cytoskeletal protein [Alphaproteobacteria bacterium]|nr:polymer-forming cytoskeletal protein [Rickettsiales bacterium]
MLKTIFKKDKSRISQEKNELPYVAKKKKSNDFSVVSKGTTLSGDFFGSGVVDVLGTVRGNICCGEVFVRNGGRVEGNIVANNVNVNGYVNGRVTCQTFSVDSFGLAEGILSYSTISIANGGVISGDCRNERITDDVIKSCQEEFFCISSQITPVNVLDVKEKSQ